MSWQGYWLDSTTGELMKLTRSGARFEYHMDYVTTYPDRFGFNRREAELIKRLPFDYEPSNYPDWMVEKLTKRWIRVLVDSRALNFTCRPTRQHLEAIQDAIPKLPRRQLVWIESYDRRVLARAVSPKDVMTAQRWRDLTFHSPRLAVGQTYQNNRIIIHLETRDHLGWGVRVAARNALASASTDCSYNLVLAPLHLYHIIRDEGLVLSRRPPERRRDDRVERAIQDATSLQERLKKTSDPSNRARLLQDLDDVLTTLDGAGEPLVEQVLRVNPISPGERINRSDRISRAR